MNRTAIYYDYIIIGGGPAGIQLAYYLSQAKQDYLVLERGENPAAFFDTHPRHRKLISINKVHTGYDDHEINLRWDWNSLLSDSKDPLLLKDYTKEYFPEANDLVTYINDFAKQHEINIQTKANVTNVSRGEDKLFSLELGGKAPVKCKSLIVATGLYLPWLPKIDGIESLDTYCDMSVNPNDYINKRVLILGKGNSAFETGNALVAHASMIHICSPNPLKMAWSTHYVGHLRAANNNFLDTYLLKSQNAVLDADITHIRKFGDEYIVKFKYRHAENEIETITYDKVIACTGFRFDNSIFSDGCKPEMCAMNKLPAQKNSWESKNIEDLYFAGTLMQYLDYKKYMSGFIHGFRYNIKILARLLLDKHGVTSISRISVDYESNTLAERVIERVNKSSSLWQQPGFICDVILPDSNLNQAIVIEELNVGYCLEQFKGNIDGMFILTLEFGKTKYTDPFSVSRIARDNVRKANESNFIHPVVRYYKNAFLVSEHHIIEDLAAEWTEPEHILPLGEYFTHTIDAQCYVTNK